MWNATREGNQVKCVYCYSQHVLCIRVFIIKGVHKFEIDRYIDTQADKKWILICRTPQIAALFSSLLSIQISLFRREKIAYELNFLWKINSFSKLIQWDEICQKVHRLLWTFRRYTVRTHRVLLSSQNQTLKATFVNLSTKMTQTWMEQRSRRVSWCRE